MLKLLNALRTHAQILNYMTRQFNRPISTFQLSLGNNGDQSFNHLLLSALN
jgi:hypothetical protein